MAKAAIYTSFDPSDLKEKYTNGYHKNGANGKKSGYVNMAHANSSPVYDSRFEDSFSKGKDKYQKGYYLKAIKYFSEIPEYSDLNIKKTLYKGHCYSKLGEKLLAKNSYGHVIFLYSSIESTEKKLQFQSEFDQATRIINEKQDKWLPPLIRAARDGKEEVIKEFLKDTTLEQINQVDLYGYTALHCAVHSCQIGTIKELIEKGADVNKLDSSNKTPLYYALHNPSLEKDQKAPQQKEQKEIVSLLIENGAAINISDHPELSQIVSKNPGTVITLLQYAIICNEAENAKLLLKYKPGAGAMNKPADPNEIGINGLSAMHLAAKRGEIGLLKFMIENHGGDIYLTSAGGESLLHSAVNAVLNGHEQGWEIVRWLCQKWPNDDNTCPFTENAEGLEAGAIIEQATEGDLGRWDYINKYNDILGDTGWFETDSDG